MQSDRLKLVNIQLALFTRDVPQVVSGDALNFVNQFIQKLSITLAGTPTILSLPIEAPFEVPRVIIKSDDEKYACNISRGRIDMFTNINSIFDQNNIRQDFHSKVKNVGILLSEKNIEVFRIGYISNFEVNVGPKTSAPEYIRDHFISAEQFGSPHELVIQYIERQLLINLNSNVLQLLKQKNSGITVDRNTLVVQYDINTIPEESQNRNIVDQVFEYSESALTKIVSLIPSLPEV